MIPETSSSILTVTADNIFNYPALSKERSISDIRRPLLRPLIVSASSTQTDDQEQRLINERKQQYCAFRSTSSSGEAMRALDKIQEIETKLRKEYGYTLERLPRIEDSYENLGCCLTPKKSDSKTSQYRLFGNMPEGAAKALRSTGYYDDTARSVAHIFFTGNCELYPNIFPHGQKQIGRVDILSRSVIISSKTGDISDMELAGTLVHEAFHLQYFGMFNSRAENEKRAYMRELDFWQKISAADTNYSAQDRETIDSNMSSIKEALKNKDY